MKRAAKKVRPIGLVVDLPDQVKIVEVIGVDADGNFYKLNFDRR